MKSEWEGNVIMSNRQLISTLKPHKIFNCLCGPPSVHLHMELMLQIWGKGIQYIIH